MADHTSFEFIGLVITKPILSVITGTDSEIYKKKKEKKRLELMGHDERYYFEWVYESLKKNATKTVKYFTDNGTVWC